MKVCLFTIGLILLSGLAHASESHNRLKPVMAGWQTGVGFQHGLQVNYHYDVCFFLVKYHFPVFQNQAWSIDIVPQPQINISRYKVSNNSPDWLHGMEFGLNLGVAVRQQMADKRMGIYLLGGVGPHYVSGVPERQAKGFIFSDYIALGMVKQLSDRIALDISAGFRHISNSSLKRPNGGVNNLVVMGGVVYRMKNEK